ncbi:helix-turn-helix domain-containing protein [Brevundimonas diminuta]|uniref:helix-turn-helix domain-containing protein n=1 Tax=Brevundimonas TaxID=41275 RepID=UPI0019C43173|nr:helix-turn-helix domain-containing protein [Brevundimonas diminuta]MBD3818129.1 helix-turn-helix domain-containing protein [Brevundimonas diminuta]
MARSTERPERTAGRALIPERVNVREIRDRLGLTQVAFADRFGFNIHTLRQWEQGIREPEAPTRVYLEVIDRAPEAVARALGTL